MKVGDRVELSGRHLEDLKQWSRGTVKQATKKLSVDDEMNMEVGNGELGVEFDDREGRISVTRLIINSVGDCQMVRVLQFCRPIKS